MNADRKDVATLTGKRKVYAGVLLLAIAALMIDRAFLQPGEAGEGAKSARAYAVPPEEGGVEIGAEAAAAAFDVPDRPTIADRLDRLARERQLDLARVPDAFLPSAEWASSFQAEPSRGVSAAERFKQAHALTGVMASGDGGYAIIDGRMLFIGQVLDGFTLVAVRRRSAVLESDGLVVELALEE